MVYVYLGMDMATGMQCHGSPGALFSPGAEVTSGCKPPDMGSEN